MPQKKNGHFFRHNRIVAVFAFGGQCGYSFAGAIRAAHGGKNLSHQRGSQYHSFYDSDCK
jgi:hypothetical protein